MARVVITGPADADSAEIISDLTANAGELVADRYVAELNALYRRLATFPESGSPRPKLGRFIRIGLVSPYVVVYRHAPDNNLVAVIRILHGRRRITRRTLTQPTAPP
ncbi:toxin ParE1/3/4 [Roseiarcus fermentans]|uniref:Toxin ParE1/3/4 n=1 Tax=Roseiarcus fermentans TaxID=1473586 RepID=A0A366FKA9_9HYPH|nr:type II toxin-antitoxin system RelE/ParE family toxin [Roseiarcus fermentans]RBP14155.1 toxin ParE1/3/4 [Roseiarcus fermentans]